MPGTLITGTVAIESDGTIIVTDPHLIEVLHANYHGQINAGLQEAAKSLGIHVKFASPCSSAEANQTTKIHDVNSLCTC